VSCGAPLIGIVDQPIAKDHFQVETAIDSGSTMFANPSLKRERNVPRRISVALILVLCGCNVGVHEDFSELDHFAVIVDEPMLEWEPVQVW
jgi:hypothetical protein